MSYLPYQSVKLDHIFDPVLDFHAQYLERVINKAEYKSLNHDIRLREFHTVRIGFGRQIGKSNYIARSAGAKDIIFCRGRDDIEKMKAIRSVIRPQHAGRIESWLVQKEIVGVFENVWVDDASILSKDELDFIYNELGELCKRFILIG